jgi:hypothetical protein
MNYPTYENYQKRALSERSVKIELRQRIYSLKTHDYRITYLPFVVEVTHQMTWRDLVSEVDMIISKLAMPEQNGGKEREGMNQSLMHKAKPESIKLSNSGIQVHVETPGHNEIRVSQSGKGFYKMRVIKTDNHYDNCCFFCKGEFRVTRRAKPEQVCKG